MRTFKVYRYWPVEYQSIAEVEAATVEEACDIALHDDDDYSDAESCDGSDGPTEIGRVVEIVDGEEIERDVPGDSREVVEFTREEAAALLSGINVALDANGGDCPDSVREALVGAVERLNAAFDFGL